MKQILFTLLILLVSFCIFASAKGKNKDEKPRKKGMASLTSISRCMGQEVRTGSAEIETSVESCLVNRVQEIQEQVEAEIVGKTNANAKKKEKAEKKLAKKKEKIEKKVRQKCALECEWSVFDLIPDTNGTASDTSSNYPLMEIPEDFMELFPSEARESLKTGMESCYNSTSPAPLKNGKKFNLHKACLRNKKLFKCLGKTIRKTCNGKAGTNSNAKGTSTGNTEAPLATPMAKSDLENTPTSKTTANPVDEEDGDDENDDDDDDLDDDDDDEEEDSTTVSGVSVSVTTTTKSSMPASEVDTSQPITK